MTEHPKSAERPVKREALTAIQTGPAKTAALLVKQDVITAKHVAPTAIMAQQASKHVSLHRAILETRLREKTG